MLMKNEVKIAREQLDSWHVSRYRKARAALLKRPRNGWIRAIRFTLGMSGRQLAERLGISKNSVSAIEKREQDGSVTIRMMMRVAEAMDCTFFYGFLPNGSFEEIVRRRAGEVARDRIDRINLTMRLEGQELPEDRSEEIWRREVERLADLTPRTLWNRLSSRETDGWK
jgi:predicted DNA-binding mobile mystery protein A